MTTRAPIHKHRNLLGRVAPRRGYGPRSASPVRARDRDRSLRPARPGRLAATVLVVGLVLLGAAAAEAQTERILVSNTAVGNDDTANTSGNDHAQLFHTGGHTGGYTLTKVRVNSEDDEGDDFDVEVCEEDGSADEFPSTTASDCTALTAPSDFTAGLVLFTHAGLALSANTNYVVVIKQRGTGSVRFKSTTNTGEDTSLGLSGWSIKDKFYWKSGSTWMIKSGSNEALRIVVSGYEGAAVDTTPPSLESATVRPDGATIELVFDEDWDVVAASLMTGTAFSVTADGNPVTVGSLSFITVGVIVDRIIELRSLSPTITYGQAVIVSYTDPTTGDDTTAVIQDVAGNDVASFTTGAGGVPAVINNLPPPVASTDATLSALALSGVTLSPAFDADTETYTASVANSVATTTVTAMATDADATVAVTPSTDADAVTSGHQVNLGVGPTTITATVTAEDGMTTKTYTVVVTRAAQTCTVPTGGIWGACLTWATISIGSTFDTSLPLTGLGCRTTSCGDTSVLTSRDFSFGGKNYRIEAVDLRGGTLEFNLLTPNADTAAADFSSVVLHVGTSSYSLASASFVGNSEAFAWTNTGLSWSANDKAALQLVDLLASTNAVVSLVSNIGQAENSTSSIFTYDHAQGFTTGSNSSGYTLTSIEVQISTSGSIASAVVRKTDPNTGDLVAALTGPGTGETVGTGAQTFTAPSGTSLEPSTEYFVVFESGSGANSLTFSLTNADAEDASAAAGWSINDSGHFRNRTQTGNFTPFIGSKRIRVNGTINAITTNASPAFSAATATRSVPENTAANTNIGTALPAATDTDNDPLTYTLEGADATSFGFDPATRQLSTKSGVTYDRETQSSYAVTLKADDDNGGTDTIAVTITLTNVIEPPDRPAAPSVTATAGTTDSLSVSWTAPSNTGPAIDNYDLRYREGTGGSWTTGPQNVSATSATIAGLTANTLYQVQVLATNAEGDSPWSPSGSGQTSALGAPDVPHSLDATPGNGQVMLSWVLPSGGAALTHYEYEQDGSGTWISTGGTATDYTVRNLTNGQPYTFRVRAVNSAGASAASAASPSVTPATVPGAPTGLSATVSDRRVDLMWTAPASDGGQSITDYEYEQGGSGTWISTGSTATSYMVHNLTNGQPYRFRVRAVNSVGAGAASAASPNVTPATEPDAPTGLSATVSDQKVDLIWTAPASNGGAPILRYEYELDFSDTWTSTGGTATSYTVTGLTNGQSYTFRVRALNRVGAGLASSSQSATPTSTVVAPDAPFGLSATPGNRQVMLSWVQPSGGAALTHYEYEQDGSVTWTSTGGTAPSHTVTGLTNGQPYTFKVRAVNSAGQSAATNSQSATPTTTEPEAPESLRFTPGDQQVTLRWRAPTNDGGEPILRYEYDQDGSGTWISTDGTATSHTVTGLNNGQTYTFRVRAVNALGTGAVVMLEATPSPSTGGRGGGGGGGGGPRITRPGAPENLLAEGGDGQVKLTWEAPEDDGGSEITDYQYRINGRNPWTSIGSTQTTHTLTGLVNGTAYVFEVRAVNRIGRGRASNRAKATPMAPLALDFAHFANGTGITSEMVLVNVAPHPIRPAIYFYDRGGHLIDPESVVDVTGDLEVTEDGSLSVLTEMEPLEALTISTHGQGELVSGSVKVLSDGPIGGGVRYGLPEIGVAGVGASPPVRDVLFPARRQEGGIRTATALHNLGEEAVGVRCRLMSGGVALEEAEIPLEANGQASWFIEEAFPTTDTSDFLGSVRCTVLGSRRFTAIAVEVDAAQRIFNTLSVVPLDRTGGGNKQTTLDFAHFVNGTWITDLVFVNLSTEASRPAPTPFHTDILPSRPAIYFYDTEGNPIAAESVVDITGDLEITEDGALTVQTEMEPLGVLTISTHGRGALVSGSVRVVSEGPIGGMLRFEHPDLGVAGVGASPPLSDALFPVRRQEGGINTGVALHNLESSAGLVHCDLMREGVLLDGASIPLEANGQASWLIDQAFPDTDTSDFAGSVRCSAVGGDLFTAVALEMDHGTRIFTTLPVVPVPERMSQE